MLEAIESARAAHGFHLWAYVLMPEQIHLLIWPPSPAYDIGAILTSLKQPVAKRAVRFVRWHAPAFLGRMTDRQPNGKEAGRFWQRGGGHDRTLWEPRDVWEMIDYIHANPVRRGLCRRPEEWPWSSATGLRGRSSRRAVPRSGLAPIRPSSLITAGWHHRPLNAMSTYLLDDVIFRRWEMHNLRSSHRPSASR